MKKLLALMLAAALALSGVPVQSIILKNLKSSFAPQGTVPQLRRLLGIDAEAVVQAIFNR